MGKIKECRFYLCIYNRKQACILDEVVINDLGICEECIIVNVAAEELEERKREQYRLLREREEGMQNF